jgi:hypothetical protein
MQELGYSSSPADVTEVTGQRKSMDDVQKGKGDTDNRKMQQQISGTVARCGT